jgi:hypothetical protein
MSCPSVEMEELFYASGDMVGGENIVVMDRSGWELG